MKLLNLYFNNISSKIDFKNAKKFKINLMLKFKIKIKKANETNM